ncbi:tetratricopeptide repeat protein [Streptomyces sp. SPB074]|uniref:tetratricopeptide repeat protein n=1 Tax=Streptomyces sp. (strain SPB074) TaxID=465543 RepID=UPI0001D1E150|nr:tetratricopeptide repeat protein [Streptomyces sp. SPB074]EFG65284.1 conserved hypothetical protein [Streptomyces sp. SPB074]
MDTGTRAALIAAPLEWLEAERLALVAVVVQAAGLGLGEVAWRITAAASVLFDTRNYPDDCRVCARAALAACEARGDRRGTAAMLHELGRAAADPQGETLALGGLAQIALERGAHTDALALAEEAVRLGAGNARGLAQALHRLGQAHLARGAHAAAGEVFTRVVELVRAKADRVGLVYATLGLGESLLGSGEVDRAARTLTGALAEVARIRNPLVDGRVHLALAEARHRQGRTAEAAAQPDAAQEAFSRIGARGWLVRTEAARSRLEEEAEAEARAAGESGVRAAPADPR